MKTHIALIRGINVGGHRKVPMAELKVQLSKFNFENVKTYIQTGNVIFQSSKNIKTIKKDFEALILKYFGFEVVVLVKSIPEFKTIFNSCPFQIEIKENSYFIMLEKKPDADLIKEVEALSTDNETFHITKNCIYFYSANGYGRTKYNSNFFERKLKVNATARNYKTMLKILAMV